MKMNEFMVTYALEKGTRKGIFIGNVEKGTGKYLCEGCMTEVVAVQGPKNAWHYRHTEDKYSNCKGGPMTKLHQNAIRIIYDHSEIPLPNGKLVYNERITGKKFKSIYPDISVRSLDGRLVHFEIKVTHRDSKKEIWYKQGNHRSVEINLEQVPYDIEYAELMKIVLEIVHNKRIIHWELNEVSHYQPAATPQETWFDKNWGWLLALAGLLLLWLWRPKWLFERRRKM
jgi:MYXO-CTERM domain-containing protein